MTTRFPQLPVLGHVPKKRLVDLTRTITLAQLYEILDSEWLDCIEDRDYQLQRIRQEATRIAAKSRARRQGRK